MTLAWDADDERVVIEVFPVAEVEVGEPGDRRPELSDSIEEPEPDEVLLVRPAAGAGPRLLQRAAGRRRRRPAAVPVLRRPAGPRRATCARAPTATARTRDRPVTGAWSRGRPRPARAARGRRRRVHGRIMPASNATFLAEVATLDGAVPCVYKPVAGERPLWDFPDGTLAEREVAAYVVSEATGWDVVPPTVLRDGPAGAGHGPALARAGRGRGRPVDVVRAGRACPPGYLHVLDGDDGADDEPVVLVHDDSRAAAPDGGVRRASSTTPTARAGTCCRWPTATATASTTASASTPRTSCARCCGAGPASR